ncbi:unnamed protein product [Rhizoctonia solani]|uniref:Transmembrane protein n=1 Tax=Rhizoctonia solani TaxID=456999 RepID=A0A8H3AE09_9AGAM|nr:unnamed protein product [Rhizoctonia solani]
MTSSQVYASSTRGSAVESTVRPRTRTRTATVTSITTSRTSRTPNAVISKTSGVAPTRTTSQPAAASTDASKPPQDSASSLTVGLAVGIAFLFLAILTILLLFYLRRRRAGQRHPAPQFRPLQQPQSDEKRLSANARYSGYSVASAPLWTVDEEREDELTLSESQAKRNWSRTIRSMLGRFTWLSQASGRQTGAKSEMSRMSERRERLPPPPVSRGRLERQLRR